MTLELPRFKCHKEVQAAKIVGFMSSGPFQPNAIYLNLEGVDAPVEVTPDWMERHNPERGGYYVVYEDGYTSYSPAKAFEEGYTRIE